MIASEQRGGKYGKSVIVRAVSDTIIRHESREVTEDEVKRDVWPQDEECISMMRWHSNTLGGDLRAMVEACAVDVDGIL